MAKKTKIKDRISKLFSNSRKYSLYKEIEKNDLFKSQMKVANRKAINRVRAATEPMGGKPLLVGTMVTFRYKEPKTKDKLPFYDSAPLVVILGYRKGANGEKIEMGLNIHFFPRKIRFLVLDKIFNMYKRIYDAARKKGISREFNIDYKRVMRGLAKYNPEFALRSYIPSLRSQTYDIPVDVWKDAVFIEPRFRKMDASKIYNTWNNKNKFNKKRK